MMTDKKDFYSVFVGRLNRLSTSGDLRSLFKRFGKISLAYIVVQKETSFQSSYGFVHFDSEADAQQAVAEMNGYEYKGFKLKVEMAGTRVQKKKVPESTNRKPFPGPRNGQPTNVRLLRDGRGEHSNQFKQVFAEVIQSPSMRDTQIPELSCLLDIMEKIPVESSPAFTRLLLSKIVLDFDKLDKLTIEYLAEKQIFDTPEVAL